MERDRMPCARFLVLLPVLTNLLWSADSVIGTWRLNVQKSRFLPGPAFQSEIRTYEEQKEGVKVTIRAVDGKGRRSTIIYLTTPDGQQHVVSGSGGPADSVALKRVNEFTAESILLHAGKEIAKTVRVIDPEGTTMTITYKGLDPEGNSVDNRLVFERVK
jgi:hypothetical protein